MDAKSYKGLTSKEVEDSRVKNGNNVITPPKPVSLWRLFFEKFNDPIIKILLLAAVVSLVIAAVEGGFEEPIGIFIAIILATGISFYFERDANKKFDALVKVNDDLLVKVVRNGAIIEVPRQDIVVGDIVMVETGDEVPADGELLEAVSLQIDESTLTGEPMIEKTTNPEEFHPEATYPSNHIMRGTNVLDGYGTMRVIVVGDRTQYGQVAKNATTPTEEETPLNRQLNKLATLISGGAVILGIITFFIMVIKSVTNPETEITAQQESVIFIIILALLTLLIKGILPSIINTLSIFKMTATPLRTLAKKGWGCYCVAALLIAAITYVISGLVLGFYSPVSPQSLPNLVVVKHILEAFMVAVTLIVVVVPEGLPMSITLSLALNMRRMLKANNLVRKIHATETMGATTVICTDKTGTLTQNIMTVESLIVYGTESKELNNTKNAELLTEAIAANTTAQLGVDADGRPTTMGNPTEGALLNYLKKHQLDYAKLRSDAKMVDQLTFSTQRKYMATIVNSAVNGERVLYVKGAPEIVLAKCNEIQLPDSVDNLSNHINDITDRLTAAQSRAMRTLAFATKDIEVGNTKSIEEMVEDGLIFQGFATISDPVREDVPDAVMTCIKAGVAVKIVTGDTSATAREIGRQIGIWNPEVDSEENIITGVEFEALSDQEAYARVKKLKIMSRARPTDKQRLVSLLQKGGEVVAVTGDGTNDAPALNQAHVGLSMGTGTAVAKEASDITLLDDSFASIATAVMWGRSLYRNIQRFLLFQLTVNIVALATVFLGVFFTSEPPLTVMQMLWVNIIMDTFAALAFASIPPEKNVMDKRPRNSQDFIINKHMFTRMAVTSTIFILSLIGMLTYFIVTDTVSRGNMTLFFTVFVLMHFVNIFIVRGYEFKLKRSDKKTMLYPPTFIVVSLLILIGQIVIVTFGGEAFRVEPLSLTTWGILFGVIALPLIIDTAIKLKRRD